MKRFLKYFRVLNAVTCLGAWSLSLWGATYIHIDGSSTVYPITEAVAEEFQKANPNLRVTVGISGTGGGFKRFCRGETDIADASRPIKSEEKNLCAGNGIEYMELPVAFDGLAVMVNPENDWVQVMTVSELKIIWEPEAQGTVTKWNQIRPEWPDAEIKLFGPGTDSGTYDYFTAAIVGQEGASRGDFTSSEDDNVLVYGIAGDKYALGFFGLAYYEENKDKLKLLAIDDEKGDGPVFPSKETVNNGTYQPLSRPIFIYVSKKAAERPELNKFVRFYLDHAASLSQEVGFVPLPSGAYRAVTDRFLKGKIGSVFSGGSMTGVSIEEMVIQ